MRHVDLRAITKTTAVSTLLDAVASTEISDEMRHDVLAGKKGTFKDFLALYRRGSEAPGSK